MLDLNICPFCESNVNQNEILFTNEHCLFLQGNDPVLIGSGLIVPRKHRSTVFELEPEEWVATFALLDQVKHYLDEQFAPDGYNVGWNCGRIAGQVIFHAHLHVIPRFQDEPLAGKGIRHWLKQGNNKRPLRIDEA